MCAPHKTTFLSGLFIVCNAYKRLGNLKYFGTFAHVYYT
jgi:hypothetical protein